MTTHQLKTHPPYFDAILDGSKPFEVRRNDRGFEVGDILRLREWDPNQLVVMPWGPFSGDYTGREVSKRVTYVLGYSPSGPRFGVEPGYVVMGLADLPEEP